MVRWPQTQRLQGGQRTRRGSRVCSQGLRRSRGRGLWPRPEAHTDQADKGQGLQRGWPTPGPATLPDCDLTDLTTAPGQDRWGQGRTDGRASGEGKREWAPGLGRAREHGGQGRWAGVYAHGQEGLTLGQLSTGASEHKAAQGPAEIIQTLYYTVGRLSLTLPCKVTKNALGELFFH